MTSKMEKDAEYLSKLGEILYGSPSGPDQIQIDQLRGHFPDEASILIDQLVQTLSAKGLVNVSIFQQTVSRTLSGKKAHDLLCIPEIVLGEPYINSKYSNAIFHVIVQKSGTETTGGTAFFSEDFPEFLVTARHVANSYPLDRIENQFGRALPLDGYDFLLPKDESLDLALIRCAHPIGVQGFRIAWDSIVPEGQAASGQPPEKVLIFGYPPAAFHDVSLFVLHGTIESRSKLWNRQRESLMISKSRPGCSGGPVVDYRGIVVGVISGAGNQSHSSAELESKEKKPQNLETEYVTAIPAAYLSEIGRN